MNDFQEQISRYLHLAINILVSKHPGRTSLGIVLGPSIFFGIEVAAKVTGEKTFIDLVEIDGWKWIPPSILICHSPTLIKYLSTKTTGNEDVDERLELIERGNFSEIEKRALFRELIEDVARNARFTKQISREIEKISSGFDDPQER